MIKVAISTYLSIITLNVKGLNVPIKTQSGWMEFLKDPYICCTQEIRLRSKDTQTENEMFHGNGNEKLG